MSMVLATNKDFGRALQNLASLWSANQTARLVFAGPPLRVPIGWPVEMQDSPLLRDRGIGGALSGRLGAQWPEERLNATRYPCLICVLAGEADFRIGVTRRMAAANPQISKKCGCYVVSLPERSFLLIPPGTPFSDASRPHWERPHLEAARSHLMWFHVLPSGVSVHTCTTRGAMHELSSSVFVHDAHLVQIIEAMSEEMRAGLPRADAITGAYLQALMLRIERGLVRAQPLSGEEKRQLFAGEDETNPPADTTSIVARAKRYIQTNLNEALTVERIATHAYISPPHLNRLFRSELQMSVMQFVTAQRLEMARSLLRETDLPIQRISTMSGYRHAAHFTRAFTHATGLGPLAFRRRERATSAKNSARAVKPTRRPPSHRDSDPTLSS
jgi:AraC-like DNA-binding protein